MLLYMCGGSLGQRVYSRVGSRAFSSSSSSSLNFILTTFLNALNSTQRRKKNPTPSGRFEERILLFLYHTVTKVYIQKQQQGCQEQNKDISDYPCRQAIDGTKNKAHCVVILLVSSNRSRSVISAYNCSFYTYSFLFYSTRSDKVISDPNTSIATPFK